MSSLKKKVTLQKNKVCVCVAPAMQLPWLSLSLLALVEGITLEQQWHSWKNEHGKVYSGKSEERLRRQIWRENVEKIQRHSNDDMVATFSLAVNQFADLVSKLTIKAKLYLYHKQA